MLHAYQTNGNGTVSNGVKLTGHALRNAHLREHSLKRAETAPPLAQAVVRIRAATLQMTRLEFSRRSGMSRGVLRDLELGVHWPTRQTLQQFVDFCRKQSVSALELEELRRLYAGTGETLEELIGRLELEAGSSRELAKRAGISPTTLWEYRRGNFPIPLGLLQKLCDAVGESRVKAESIWEHTERERFIQRGYPRAWAELCVLCSRAGKPESCLHHLGVTNGAFRRLRYLELPPWDSVKKAAEQLTRSKDELLALEQLWCQEEKEQRRHTRDTFGRKVKELREKDSIERRKLADLFGIGGKKPARIIKHIEEDGFYSQQAFPAGLVAVLEEDPVQQEKILTAWKQRRRQFHKRRRPETRAELRLTRELYGFEIAQVAEVLGYSSLEYQHIERGREPLLPTAEVRILQAIHQAGHKRVVEVLKSWDKMESAELAWQAPRTLPEMIALLARREGGLAPLSRYLRQSGLDGIPALRLRAMMQGKQIPAWCQIQQIANLCGVEDAEDVHDDWEKRYRAQLSDIRSPLGIELRILIAEITPSLRAFSPRLGFNYSVLVREFNRLDNDDQIRWYHVERILTAADIPRDSDRWRQVRVLWSTISERGKSGYTFNSYRKD